VNINITRDDWWHYVREEYYKRIIIKFQTKKIANKLKNFDKKTRQWLFSKFESLACNTDDTQT
jgi:hypothetical protein